MRHRYKIEITHGDGAGARAADFVQTLVPTAMKVADFAGVITFEVPLDQVCMCHVDAGHPVGTVQGSRHDRVTRSVGRGEAALCAEHSSAPPLVTALLPPW